MTNEQREIHRKKRVLEHAERMGNVNKTCRYFGVASSTQSASCHRRTAPSSRTNAPATVPQPAVGTIATRCASQNRAQSRDGPVGSRDLR